MSSPNQSLMNGDLLASPAGTSSNQSSLNKSSNSRPLKLRRVNHTEEVFFNFSNFLRNDSMTDVTLICNGGQTIRAHRVILSTFSPYFRAIFESQPFSNNPYQYPVIVIKDLELNELKTIIDFIYKGEVSVSRDKLTSVLQAAKALEVSGLADLKMDSLSTSNNSQSNGVNTLLANSLMNSPNTVNNQQNLNDLNDKLNFGSLSALNYVCSLNGKRNQNLNNSNNNSLDAADLFNEKQLNKLRVSIEDSSELFNSLGTSLLGDNTVNIDGVRSLLQQPPRMPQSIQQIKQSQYNQLQSQISKQRQMQQMLQRQQLQRIQQQRQNQMQQAQLKQQILQFNQNGSLKNKYSVPKNNTLQGQQLAQFQEKIKQQIQEKQQQQQQKDSINGKSLEELAKLASKDQDIEEIEQGEINENGDDNGDDKMLDQNEQNDLIVDDENNNQINKQDGDSQLDDNKNGDDKNGDDLENGIVDYDENGDQNQMNPDDEEEYEIDINKDLVFQRQQQIRLEQLQKQQHFQQQFQLMSVDDPENRNLEFQKQLLQAAGLHSTNGELNEDALNNGSRRNSSKDSLLQTSSASGSEDTDNDNINDNTMDLNDNLGLIDGNYFDDYNNLTQGSPIPMQVKINPSRQQIPQTPDFLLPRGPGRPRKGNKCNEVSPCPECHKKFVRPDVLKLHYRSVHLLERHPCNMCEKVFKWPGDLSKHKRKSCKGNTSLSRNNMIN